MFICNHWSILLVLVFVLGCTPKNPGVSTGEEATTTSEEGASTITDILSPNEAEMPYPIYASFDDIAPVLDQRDGRTYVVNFWATWCQPCVAELPYFEQLATEKPEVEIVMVSLDFKRDIRTKLKKFVEERPFSLPVVALADTDYNAWIGQVDQRWGGAIPITVVYRDGKRKFHNEQFASYEELAEMVERVE